MATDTSFQSSLVPIDRSSENSVPEVPGRALGEMKERQRCKIRELRNALADAGFLTLNQQAEALGLSRSTTWAILTGNHKGSGLSAATINRMLASTMLPPRARKIIDEYIAEKATGVYGSGPTPRQRFTTRLAETALSSMRPFSKLRSF